MPESDGAQMNPEHMWDYFDRMAEEDVLQLRDSAFRLWSEVQNLNHKREQALAFVSAVENRCLFDDVMMVLIGVRERLE